MVSILHLKDSLAIISFGGSADKVVFGCEALQ